MSIISEEKRTANRANAQKSTGPRTLAGKLASRLNALKHGLTARQVVLPGEDAQEFTALSHEMLARYRPLGRVERILVDRASRELWRLRRAGLAEAACLADAAGAAQSAVPAAEGRSEEAEEMAAVGAAVAADFTGPRMIERLALYEARIGRSFEKALNLLDRVRLARPPATPRWRPAPPLEPELPDPFEEAALQAAFEAEADRNLALPEP